MSRRVRLGGVEIAVDRSWVFAWVRAAGTLVSVRGRLRGRLLPALSPPLMIVVLGVAAAMGLFASLGFLDHAHGSDVERDPASPRRWIEAFAASRAPENA